MDRKLTVDYVNSKEDHDLKKKNMCILSEWRQIQIISISKISDIVANKNGQSGWLLVPFKTIVFLGIWFHLTWIWSRWFSFTLELEWRCFSRGISSSKKSVKITFESIAG